MAFAGSFVVFQLTPPTDSGFTRGLNRVVVFLGWQAVATTVAVLLLPAGNALAAGSATRWLARAPILLAGLLMVVLAGVVVVAVASGG